MDMVYRKFRKASMNPQTLMDELGIDITEGGESSVLNMVRKEVELSGEEKQYLLAVERGDIPTVRHLLEESQIYFNMNVNCVDPLGRSSLLISIENENIELLEVLLGFGIEVGDSLLHAINEENVEAVELLLRHQSAKKKDLSQGERASQPKNRGWRGLAGSGGERHLSDVVKRVRSKLREAKRQRGKDIPEEEEGEEEEGFLGCAPSSSFTSDITPIVLAAHRDNYEIIKILLARGDRIPKPHDVRCSCTECVTKANEDSLSHSRSRINAYRALSSPSLIALSSKDPILTAFELSWELRRLSRLENEFKLDYEQLARQCSDFAVGLLTQTRGSKELETILNHDTNGPVRESGERMNLARLKLAIKFKQKKFVAHPNCQQLLASLWYEGLPGFRRRHIVFKAILTGFVCVLYPLLSALYLLLPKTFLGRFMRQPFIKFICYSASYMNFLFLLVLASQRIESLFGASSVQSAAALRLRGSVPTTIEWMILAYVAGFVWSEIKQLWDEGAKSYIQDMWNIVDFITNSLYIATFTLKLIAYLKVQQEKAEGKLTWMAPREQWDPFDPNLISEGLFASANIFSSLKLIYIFTVNPHLGPLQITLGRMVYDVIKFLVIAVLVLISFSCGVNQLYWYYATARQKECEICIQGADPRDCECDKTLANLFEILQSLYFAVYGLVDVRHFELKEDHHFTEFVGKLMFGSYNGIMIVVLLNMLIAMLSNSFQLISNDADTEWKFARSKLWMSFFEEGATVPPPFNIVPTPKTAWYVVLWLRDKLCTCSLTHNRSKWQSIRRLVKKVNERELRYQAVIRDLVKRYIMNRQRDNQTEGVTEDDMNEIKQDISSFRYELLEILRSNGMTLPSGQHGATKSRNFRMKPSKSSSDRINRRMNLEVGSSYDSGADRFTFRQSRSSDEANSTSPESSRETASSKDFCEHAEHVDGGKSGAAPRTMQNGTGVRNAAFDALPGEEELKLDPARLLKDFAGGKKLLFGKKVSFVNSTLDGSTAADTADTVDTTATNAVANDKPN